MATTKTTKNGGNGGNSRTADPLKGQRDDKGSLIDPPTIPEYERRLADAHLRADVDDIADITEEYTKAREERALKLAKRKQEKAA